MYELPAREVPPTSRSTLTFDQHLTPSWLPTPLPVLPRPATSPQSQKSSYLPPSHRPQPVPTASGLPSMTDSITAGEAAPAAAGTATPSNAQPPDGAETRSSPSALPSILSRRMDNAGTTAQDRRVHFNENPVETTIFYQPSACPSDLGRHQPYLAALRFSTNSRARSRQRRNFPVRGSDVASPPIRRVSSLPALLAAATTEQRQAATGDPPPRSSLNLENGGRSVGCPEVFVFLDAGMEPHDAPGEVPDEDLATELVYLPTNATTAPGARSQGSDIAEATVAVYTGSRRIEDRYPLLDRRTGRASRRRGL